MRLPGAATALPSEPLGVHTSAAAASRRTEQATAAHGYVPRFHLMQELHRLRRLQRRAGRGAVANEHAQHAAARGESSRRRWQSKDKAPRATGHAAKPSPCREQSRDARPRNRPSPTRRTLPSWMLASAARSSVGTARGPLAVPASLRPGCCKSRALWNRSHSCNAASERPATVAAPRAATRTQAGCSHATPVRGVHPGPGTRHGGLTGHVARRHAILRTLKHVFLQHAHTTREARTRRGSP